ncbi:alpha-amylase family glycosyl hydrolase [Flavobacterium rhizosphaerae]|uniref:Alpha-amylase family glycosyl hydrolase n=1 Tax=Flavobacterium rhizosphaerae TaxID=3163298 RepID=A0ABW8Z1R3_9FLAO
MKKIAITILALTLLWSCKDNKQADESLNMEATATDSLPPVSDAMMENAVIYEANIRQYSPEGTFNAFTKDIPQLKKLGVKVLWVMPIYPISMKRRKATGDKSIEDITDPQEKKKYLGSYYAISDYTAVNPDLGTKEDFAKLVKTAHENGMYVILDWVANHTGWDHKWITEHPEYYQKNAKGEVTDPLNPETGEPWGWTDVAHLDYANKKVYEPMKNEMLYWVKEQNVDGFRCDVADNVPTEFWEWARPQLEEGKPLFMLMESNKEYLLKKAFDMAYGWDAHHLMNEIAQGKKNVTAWDSLMVSQANKYERDDIFMNFITNHDENAWNGSEYERLGADAVKTFAALTYTMPGMPLIYTGQEYGNEHRLKFFEKDVIKHDHDDMFAFYEKLGKLKNDNIALNGGKNPAGYDRIDASDMKNVLAFTREKDGQKVYYIANLSKNDVRFTLPLEGEYTDYISGGKVSFTAGQKWEAAPWQYWILTK